MDVRRHTQAPDFPTWHGGISRRVRRQRRLGLTLLTVTLIGGLAAPGVTPTAAAQNADEPVPAKLEKEAYFTESAGTVTPDTLNQFPPAVVCVVRPEVCSEQADPVTDPVGEVIESNPPEETVPQEPEQPVEPGTLPVGRQGGEPRYVSYLQFEVPEIPEGQELETFELLLHQEGVNYRSDSPAFREAVEAALVCFANRSTPNAAAICQQEFRQALESQPMRAQAQSPFGLEACAVVGDGQEPEQVEWEAGRNQDWDTQPERDCIVYAATGKFDEELEVWRFDITFIVEAWVNGYYPNNGLYIGPISADNLAFGDRDTSNNAQVSFGGEEGEVPPQIAYSFSEGYVPPTTGTTSTSGTTGSTSGTSSTGSGGSSGTSGSGGSGSSGTTGVTTGETSGGDTSGTSGTTAGTTGVTTGTTGTTGTSGTTGTGGTTGTEVFVPAPTYPGGPAPTEQPATGGDKEPEVAPPPDDDAATGGVPPAVAGEQLPVTTPWWVWLLIPLGLASLYYLARSLTADPEVILMREGAMTRLIERQAAANSATSTPALQV